MKNTKKLVALLVVLALVMTSIFVLVACNQHECTSACPECGKCTNETCTENACKDKCAGHETAEHECTSACPECGKCTDETCAEDACKDKCEGHETPEHECTSACPECGKCTNKTCAEDVCKDKCDGHEITEPEEIVVTGEVHHNARNTDYVVKVDVTVVDGIITAVKLYSEEETGAPMTTPTWGRHDSTNEGLQAWIDESIVGQSVETVMSWTVTIVDGSKDNMVGEGVTHLTGGTETSGRIIAAIQNALSKLDGVVETPVAETVTGEVHHNARNTDYVVKVDVTVVDGIITAVKLYSEEETGAPMTTPTWGRHDSTNEGLQAWIDESIVGQSVETVMGWTVTIVDGSKDNMVGEGVTHLTGGTETSGRIIAAIQNALSKLAD